MQARVEDCDSMGLPEARMPLEVSIGSEAAAVFATHLAGLLESVRF